MTNRNIHSSICSKDIADIMHMLTGACLLIYALSLFLPWVWTRDGLGVRTDATVAVFEVLGFTAGESRNIPHTGGAISWSNSDAGVVASGIYNSSGYMDQLKVTSYYTEGEDGDWMDIQDSILSFVLKDKAVEVGEWTRAFRDWGEYKMELSLDNRLIYVYYTSIPPKYNSNMMAFELEILRN